jgi:hypothetical protein
MLSLRMRRSMALFAFPVTDARMLVIGRAVHGGE